MQMRLVRRFLKEKNVGKPESRISDIGLVIDGYYFKGCYLRSGCQFILGGEYDRYANYLKNMFNSFVELGIECIVIFKGGTIVNNERRKGINTNIFNKADEILPGKIENEYCEPLFVTDVEKEVLEELNIKYFVCEYDHREALFNLARKYNYPMLTNNFEYCLFGITCILPSSVVFDIDNGFRCTVYYPNKKLFPLHDVDLMSILMAMSDEEGIYYKHLPSILQCHVSNVFKNALCWIGSQSKSSAINYLSKCLDVEEKDALLQAITNMQELFNSNEHFLLKSFESYKEFVKQPLDVRNINWFRDGVASGKVAIPYVNLKHKHLLSGSWSIVDNNRTDAMVITLDIVFYALGIMTNSTDLSITFLGRQFDQCLISTKDYKLKSDNVLQLFYNKRNRSDDVFKVAIREILCGFDFQLLKNLPEDCHMLIISLVYYCAKTNENFMNGVYSILLSYLLLGPISNEIGLLERSKFSVTHTLNDVQDNGNKNHAQYVATAIAFMDLFHVDESSLKDQFHRDILHSIAEFEHCFQQINYLNKLCGERTKCATFYKTINSTFVYNVFITLNGKEFPLDYIKTRMNCHLTYLEYTNMIGVFEKCLKTVNMEE